MTINQFITKLNEAPDSVDFENTMKLIDAHYDFEPTAFKNGKLENKTGENSGLCKLFAFAKLNNLSKEQTLACFGQYYRTDVIQNLKGTNHQNIRNFMQFGWDNITFENSPLKRK